MNTQKEYAIKLIQHHWEYIVDDAEERQLVFDDIKDETGLKVETIEDLFKMLVTYEIA